MGPVAIAVLVLVAFWVGRILRTRGLSELVGFLLVGVLVGPVGLGLVSAAQVEHVGPVLDVALGLLMFSAGERINLREVRQVRWTLPVGTAQYLVCGALVYLAARLCGASNAESILLATLGGAGGPLTLAALISRRRDRSSFAEGLLAAHAWSDVLTALAFSVTWAIARYLVDPGGGDLTEAVMRFARLGIGGVVLGLAAGMILALVGRRLTSQAELLLCILVHVGVASLLSDALRYLYPLTGLAAGAFVANVAEPGTRDRIFAALGTVETPLFLLFFTFAGASLVPDLQAPVLVLGVVFVAARLVGKIAGAFLGGSLAGRTLPRRRRLEVGLGLTPLAGVAIGLAIYAAARLPLVGTSVATVVLGSVIVFEAAGGLFVARRTIRSNLYVGRLGLSHWDGDAPREQLVEDPDWDGIEAAILSLDGDQREDLLLEHIEEQVFMAVGGGRSGRYVAFATYDGTLMVDAADPHAATTSSGVPVGRRLGDVPTAMALTLDQVLGAARTFAHDGTLTLDLDWQPRR